MVIVGNPRTFKIPDWFLNRCAGAASRLQCAVSVPPRQRSAQAGASCADVLAAAHSFWTAVRGAGSKLILVHRVMIHHRCTGLALS